MSRDDVPPTDLELLESCAYQKPFFDYEKYPRPDRYVFDENKYLDEILNYVNSTYHQHYSKNKYQATEEIVEDGHGEGFCLGNIHKYKKRYGKKGTPENWRNDILKIIHYSLIMLYVHDMNQKIIEDGDDNAT